MDEPKQKINTQIYKVERWLSEGREVEERVKWVTWVNSMMMMETEVLW